MTPRSSLTKGMDLEKARGIAARIWCEPEHAAKVMDPDFAESIAREVLAAYEAGKAEQEENVMRLVEATVAYLDRIGWCLEGDFLPEDESVWVDCKKCEGCKVQAAILAIARQSGAEGKGGAA